MKKTILRCVSLSAGYDGKSIVEDISLEVNSGEIVTIIGANGAGKSTLLKTIAGILKPIRGEVFIEDVSMLSMPAKERAKKMSLLLTDKIKSDYMTCYDVVATGRYAYTNSLGLLDSSDKNAVDEAIKAIGIESIKDRLFHQLSDGQKQRVMLARAICQKPQIIILDEPTSYLDIGYKIEIMTILENLAKNGIAVLMTMHDLDIAKKVSDKVISIKDGAVDKIGSTKELFNHKYLCELFDLDEKQYEQFYGN